MKEGGLRFNEGKLRYDLVQPDAHEGLVRVLTFGSSKYQARNWERGMAWSKVLASLKRHIAAIEKGEDYDSESGELHADHVACNAHFLSAYYRIFPQGDDRPHKYLTTLKIGLDIDGVLANFTKAIKDKFPKDVPDVQNYWNCPGIRNKFSDIAEDHDFWLSIEPLVDPTTIPFEPTCYITSRTVPSEVTKKWLDTHGFPSAPVYTVGYEKSKVDYAKEVNLDLFVDDSFKNFVELNKAGICTYLMTAPYNIRYSVGHKRIDSLQDLV